MNLDNLLHRLQDAQQCVAQMQQQTGDCSQQQQLELISTTFQELSTAFTQLWQVSDRFQLAASAVDCIIFDWDIVNRTINRTQGLVNVLGYSLEEAEPTVDWWTQLIHPDDRERVRNEVSDALATHRNFSTEYRVRHKNNQYLYVCDQGRIVRNATGKAVRVVGCTMNITKRKQAEMARQESERRLFAIANNIPGCVYRAVIHRNGTLSIPFVSAGVKSLMGLEANEMMAYPERWLAVIHPDDIAQVQQTIQAALVEMTQSKPVQQEYRVIAPSGEVKYLQDSCLCFLLDNGDVVVDGVTLDITQRKQAEQALQKLNEQLEHRVRERTTKLETLNKQLMGAIRERILADAALRKREQEFEALVVNAPDIIARFDRELRYLYVNPAVERATGLSPQAVIGKTKQELGMPEELVSVWNQTLQTVFQTGSLQQAEFSFLSSSGFKYYQSRIVPELAANGSVETVLAITRDITDHKLALEALQESEERFRQLAENIQEVFWMISPNHAQIIYVSPAYEQMWGKSCESLYEQPMSWVDAIHPEDKDGAIAALKSMSRGNSEVEYRIIRPDGSIRWIRDRGFPIQDAQGQVYRIAGIAEDITARKLAELEIYKALQREREAGELKSRFVAMTSHEFRTPLTTIKSSAEMLERYRHRLSEEKQQTHLSRIVKAVERMTQMLDDILILGKAEAGRLEFNPAPMDLVQLCYNLVQELQLTTKNDNAINFTCQSQCFPTRIDEKLLRHILTNLLSNAIKYSPPGSTVQFHLTCLDGNAIFQIQDQGIGIPPEDQPRLFESFHRASNVGTIQGTGLGLAIVKQCVDLHQGEITFTSIIGKGTTFTVTLPLNY